MNKTTDISSSDIKLNFNKDVMISHEKVLDLLRITLLVYNYGEEFKVINKDETIEQFINRASDKIENLDISEERKKILLNLKTTACSGKVCKFISNKESSTKTILSKPTFSSSAISFKLEALLFQFIFLIDTF